MRNLQATSRHGIRRHVVHMGRQLLPFFPERLSGPMLATLLRRMPGMWGWSATSERLRSASYAYRDAFPHADHQAFMTAFVAARARGLATSMAWMSKKEAGRRSTVVDHELPLTPLDGSPCLVTYLHYSIDPTLQLALIAGNRERRFRWAVLPPRPNTPLQWEDERALYLAGIKIPAPVAGTLLPVTTSGWLIEALKHLRTGGSMLIALDTALDARRDTAAKLTIGRASMPVSPAIAFLARTSEVRLIFAWPERHSGDAWTLHHREFATIAEVAFAASQWIDEHQLDWAGWHYLSARRRAIDIREPTTG
jgi:hypothetical protein